VTRDEEIEYLELRITELEQENVILKGEIHQLELDSLGE